LVSSVHQWNNKPNRNNNHIFRLLFFKNETKSITNQYCLIMYMLNCIAQKIQSRFSIQTLFLLFVVFWKLTILLKFLMFHIFWFFLSLLTLSNCQRMGTAALMICQAGLLEEGLCYANDIDCAHAGYVLISESECNLFSSIHCMLLWLFSKFARGQGDCPSSQRIKFSFIQSICF
jgi:hypothetical protein